MSHPVCSPKETWKNHCNQGRNVTPSLTTEYSKPERMLHVLKSVWAIRSCSHSFQQSAFDHLKTNKVFFLSHCAFPRRQSRFNYYYHDCNYCTFHIIAILNIFNKLPLITHDKNDTSIHWLHCVANPKCSRPKWGLHGKLTHLSPWLLQFKCSPVIILTHFNLKGKKKNASFVPSQHKCDCVWYIYS